jgi:hypothetical protein
MINILRAHKGVVVEIDNTFIPISLDYVYEYIYCCAMLVETLVLANLP